MKPKSRLFLLLIPFWFSLLLVSSTSCNGGMSDQERRIYADSVKKAKLVNEMDSLFLAHEERFLEIDQKLEMMVQKLNQQDVFAYERPHPYKMRLSYSDSELRNWEQKGEIEVLISTPKLEQDNWSKFFMPRKTFGFEPGDLKYALVFPTESDEPSGGTNFKLKGHPMGLGFEWSEVIAETYFVVQKRQKTGKWSSRLSEDEDLQEHLRKFFFELPEYQYVQLVSNYRLDKPHRKLDGSFKEGMKVERNAFYDLDNEVFVGHFYVGAISSPALMVNEDAVSGGLMMDLQRNFSTARHRAMRKYVPLLW